MESKRKAWLKRAMDIIVEGNVTKGSASGSTCPSSSTGSTFVHDSSHAIPDSDVHNPSRAGDNSRTDLSLNDKQDTTSTMASVSSSASASSKFRAVKLISTSRDIPAALSLPSLAIQMSCVVR